MPIIRLYRFPDTAEVNDDEVAGDSWQNAGSNGELVGRRYVRLSSTTDHTQNLTTLGVGSEWSVSFWHRPSTGTNLEQFFDWGDSSWYLRSESSPWRVQLVDDYVSAGLWSYSSGSWIHVVVTSDGTSIRLYVNNDLKHTETMSVSGPSVNFGGNSAAHYFSEVAIFDETFNADAVSALYNGTYNFDPAIKPVSPAWDGTHATAGGTVAYWLINEGSGSTVADFSPNGIDLTLVNSPTWASDAQGAYLDFAPASSCAKTPAPATAFNNSAVTVALKFKDSGAAGVRRIWSHLNGSATEGYSVYCVSSLVYWFITRPGIVTVGQPLGVADANGWHTVIVTYDGTNMYERIDGTVYGPLSRPGTLAGVTDGLAAYIASLDGVQQFFGDELQVVHIADEAWDLTTVGADWEADPFEVVRGSGGGAGGLAVIESQRQMMGAVAL